MLLPASKLVECGVWENSARSIRILVGALGDSTTLSQRI